MWHLVILVLTWLSAALALQLGLDDVKAISSCTEEVAICNGSNTALTTNEYVSELVLQAAFSSVIVKIRPTEVWLYKDIFRCEN